MSGSTFSADEANEAGPSAATVEKFAQRLNGTLLTLSTPSYSY